MSLTSGMWTSVSGLLAHGERMNVIGNNISNVNTLGFKSQRMDFQDFVYQAIGTASGTGQVGRGTSIGIIMNDFSQGSFETTTSSTDIAINGSGFFCVKPLNNNMTYYTRAGNFSFNREGYLVDPHGYALQGWAINPDQATALGTDRSSSGIMGVGSPIDIKLDTFTCPARHTSKISVPINLAADNAAANDKSSTTGTDPFFALLNTWNADDAPPLGSSQYAWQTTITVYDEAGQPHTLSIYFDRVADTADQPLANTVSGSTYWEFIITMDPSEDMRDFNSAAGAASTNPDVPSNLKGLLGAGTLAFDSSGNIQDMTCFVPSSDPSDPTDNWWDNSSGTDVVDLNKWVAAPVSADGFPMIFPNFTGSPGQQNPYVYDASGNITSTLDTAAESRMIAIDLGLKLNGSAWVFPNVTPGGALVTAAEILNDVQNIRGMDGQAKKVDGAAMTCTGSNFYEHGGLYQDGYTFGNLRDVYVTQQGLLTATYSNGQTLALYQVALYDFPSPQNLRREGGNLFTETLDSGIAYMGAAGTGSFGTTEGNSLEQSNADIAREFVNMITTQRGFQGNSKTITTIDTMLETVIGMKR